MVLNTKKDILMEYSKRNLCLHYGRVVHFITLFFYGKYYGNMFILIWNNQDGLERRDEHPGGVQQDKTWYIMAIRYFIGSTMETSILNYLLARGC